MRERKGRVFRSCAYICAAVCAELEWHQAGRGDCVRGFWLCWVIESVQLCCFSFELLSYEDRAK